MDHLQLTFTCFNSTSVGMTKFVNIHFPKLKFIILPHCPKANLTPTFAMDAGIHKLVSLCHHAIVINILWLLDQCFFIGIILCNRLEITPSAYIKKHHKSTIQSNYEWKE